MIKNNTRNRALSSDCSIQVYPVEIIRESNSIKVYESQTLRSTKQLKFFINKTQLMIAILYLWKSLSIISVWGRSC